MPATEQFLKLRIPAFLLALLLLAGVGVASVWGIVQFSHSAEWVEHTYEVLTQLETVETGVREAESAARAYRLTEDAARHAEYLAAAPEALQRVDDLTALVADNAEQTERSRDLRKRVVARLEELAELVEIQAEHGAERARAATLSGRGVELMRALTAKAGEMRNAERALLAAREAASTERVRILIAIVIVGMLLPMILLGLLLAGLSRENRRVRELERESRRAMQELESAAILRDRLSEQRRSLGTFTGLLQSCQTLEEALSLTRNVARELLPAAGGRCYVMRASQNVVESTAEFGTPATESAALMQPNECWALRRGQVHRIEPGQPGMRCAHMGTASHNDEWSLCVPMTAQGATLGLLHLSGRASDGWNPNDATAVEAIGEQLSQTVANLQLRESLRVQSLRDPLTGLYNRRYLEENLYRELQRCERRNLPLSVMMLDVDHFKRFNDEHGHAAGDALLSRVGEVLMKLTRGEDIACRYGGEEFTIILPEAPLEVALRRAEEIRAAMATTGIIHMRQSLGPVTMSIGVSSFPADGAAPDRLLAVADTALYRAKSEGRNRVVSGD